MKRSFAKKAGLSAALAALLLAGCAETELVVSTVKHVGSQPSASSAGVPTGEGGHYKVGNPYKIKGQWYYPRVDYDYRETGIASWYGPNFHGKKTANGEIFDQNLVSAAHKELPMPSMVRVTNLENGRAMNIRVNDRGPFARGRIIDLSKRAAQLLGFERQGTAKVLVEVLEEESRALALRMQRRDATPAERAAITAAPRAQVGSSSLPGTSGAPVQVEAKVVTRPIVLTPPTPRNVSVDQKLATNSEIFIQLGAFADPANAERLRAEASSQGPAVINPVSVNGRILYRVRLGPLRGVGEADILLGKVVDAGYNGARVVVDCDRGC